VTRIHTLIAASAVLTAASVPAAARDGAAGPSAGQVARLMSEAWCAADLAQDIEAKMALFSDDAVLIMPGRAPLDGVEEIRNWQSQNYAAARHDCVGRVNVDNVEMDGAIAILRGQFAGRVVMADGSGSFEQSGYFLNVVERGADGDWRISQMIFTY